jgi:hypothetical protein
VLLPTFKGNKAGFYISKAKHFILKMFPYLLGIKPNAYAVLTAKSDNKLAIF